MSVSVQSCAMSTLFITFIGLMHLAASLSVSTDPQCGASCNDGNDCMPSLECSFCYHGTCTPGESCGSPCVDTSDCNLLSNCSLCTGGVCSPGCSQSCTQASDCARFGCGPCINNVCTYVKCNAVCTLDSDCISYGSYCGQCDAPSHGAPGLCKSGCGRICTGDGDCPGRCAFCSSGVCSVSPVADDDTSK
ncbi:Hypothetical protein, putative [Bodo saltans]|uniref:Membrane-associated protein n=1 Tax=Bodo saltans TaxID=75058 RepID=A0A0S4JKG8_BODSA|nr:Hypothetical protein, putative [Bodo saltans]|eukprot:CUG90718.1 Hypothetical protein, putative [Bodo saltans]